MVYIKVHSVVHSVVIVQGLSHIQLFVIPWTINSVGFNKYFTT